MLTIHTAKLGFRHAETANSMNKLAGVLMLLGKQKDAKPLLEKSMEIRVLLLGSSCAPYIIFKSRKVMVLL